MLIVRVVRSCALPRGVHRRHRDVLGETFEVKQRENAARPRARVGYVQVVPAALGGVLAVGGDPVAEDGILADERAVLGDVRDGGIAGGHGAGLLGGHRAAVNERRAGGSRAIRAGTVGE